ncbi:hypothetical protein [Tardiphaga sp. 768_D3_N2_1]|uniref:hypothetical protein n=1 Tax=Tardiphaga sp. 768_D3_N2_1 TaxID=3240783 RepID=UPI003F8C5072
MSDEPLCLACGAVEIVDTGHSEYSFMCLACGCWGPFADQVEQKLHDLEPSSQAN